MAISIRAVPARPVRRPALDGAGRACGGARSRGTCSRTTPPRCWSWTDPSAGTSWVPPSSPSQCGRQGRMVVAGLVVDCGTRHRPVVVVAPTVVVVACTVLVVVVGGRVVVGGSSRMTPDGPAGPGGPCAPGAPVAPGGPAGTVVEGRDEVDD